MLSDKFEERLPGDSPFISYTEAAKPPLLQFSFQDVRSSQQKVGCVMEGNYRREVVCHYSPFRFPMHFRRYY